MKNNHLQSASPAPQENKMGVMPIAPLLAGMVIPCLLYTSDAAHDRRLV